MSSGQKNLKNSLKNKKWIDKKERKSMKYIKNQITDQMTPLTGE